MHLCRVFPVFLVVTGCAKGAADDTYAGDSGAGADSGKPQGGDGGGQPDAGKADSGSCKTAAPSNVCGLDPQCGCGASGTCDIDYQAQDGTTKCVTSSGSGQIASKCASTSDCAPGLTCGLGVCRPFCSQDMSACSQAGTGTCVQFQDSQMKPIKNFIECLVKCKLDDPSSCGGGTEGCVYFSGNDVDCRPVKTNTGSCSSGDPMCSPGYVCLSDNVCHQWCQIGSNCQSGACQALQSSITVDNVQYGVCP